MVRETWATFSVKDHCLPNAFVAEVMLYDRLVIPIPPDNEERKRWQNLGWEPYKQEKLLEILGERAYEVEWTNELKDSWKTRYEAGASLVSSTDEWAFMASKIELTINLPPYVTGIEAVTNYTSLEELTADLNLREGDRSIELAGGTVTAILGQEFLIPKDPRLGHEELLKLAVSLSSEEEFKDKRRSFWSWQRDFLNKNITNQYAIKDAVETMEDLLEEERKTIHKKKIKTELQYAFLVGSLAIGLSGSLTPLAIGGAFISIGNFLAGRLQTEKGIPKPVALFHDVRKHFGWK